VSERDKGQYDAINKGFAMLRATIGLYVTEVDVSAKILWVRL
jgi:hypothetical protein